METTGWITGQLFLQSLDRAEVERVGAFLQARGIASQTLTQSERMLLDPADPASGVTSERFSVAVQLAGFPQVVAPVLAELLERAHGRGWDDPPPAQA
ncbi:MAG TPA: hypothetical protein VMB79_08130 [Jatrophihabitans sp.]|nr:hypothetical protein [Jatrophihabitans sp.]